MWLCMYACIHFCVCVYFSFHHLRIIASTSWSSGAFSQASQPQQQHTQVAPQDLPSRKWDHHGCKTVSFWKAPGSSFPLPCTPAFAFAFTIGSVNHGLRSLPHLPNIVSALSKWWQVGLEELSGPAILREEGAYKRKYYHGEHMHSKGWKSLES